MRSLLRGKPRSVSTEGTLPSPPEISAFYSRLNHAYMHPLTCVKYGAVALALGPAHSVTVPCGAASEYLSATSKIHYCIGSLNVGVAPRVQHFSAFHYYYY